jgi:polysaccharide biosynthesis protein PslH
MNALLVTAQTPTLASGTGLRTYGVTAALARHGTVDVRYVVFGGDEPAAAYAQLPNVSLRELRPSRGAGWILRYAAARARGTPPDLARGVSPELSHGADGVPAAVRVIADGPVAAAALLPLARRRDVVYLAHNLESGFRDDPRGALARFEASVLRTYSESWMATRADEHGAIAMAGELITTRYVPNVVDLSLIDPVRAADEACLLFIGDFTYMPNREALDYLVGEVLPQSWKHQPELRLLVVGRGLPNPPSDPRVHALGFVDDLRTAYAAADIVVVPLLHGGGSPLKFIEALGYGLPVVATAHAARLLEDAVAGEHFLQAEGPAEFAAAIGGLLGDRARAAAIGAAGRELVRQRYSVDALATLLAL